MSDCVVLCWGPIEKVRLILSSVQLFCSNWPPLTFLGPSVVCYFCRSVKTQSRLMVSIKFPSWFHWYSQYCVPIANVGLWVSVLRPWVVCRRSGSLQRVKENDRIRTAEARDASQGSGRGNDLSISILLFMDHHLLNDLHFVKKKTWN